LDDAAEAALLADDLMPDSAAEMDDRALAAAEPVVAVMATLLKLCRREETSAAMEDWADINEDVAEAARLETLEPAARELAALAAAEVALAKAEEPPPMADEIWPRMELIGLFCALTTPAARRVVATMEKRILMVGLFG
jgi:hypothetical protein